MLHCLGQIDTSNLNQLPHGDGIFYVRSIKTRQTGK